jgi:hypothetical protein
LPRGRGGEGRCWELQIRRSWELGAGNWELELELGGDWCECCTVALLGSWMVTVVGFLLFRPAMVLDLSHWARPREV